MHTVQTKLTDRALELLLLPLDSTVRSILACDPRRLSAAMPFTEDCS